MCPNNPNPATHYEVIINEAQRLLLSQALHILYLEHPLSDQARKDPNVEFLLSCLERMPADEAAHPGITHGLCL